jgi:hypothetical protein
MLVPVPSFFITFTRYFTGIKMFIFLLLAFISTEEEGGNLTERGHSQDLEADGRIALN